MVTKVAVIGASGVLGRQLISRFQKAGRAVRAIARTTDDLQELMQGESEALAFDLLIHPRSLLKQYLKGCDVVIHAATALPSPLDASPNWTVNNRLRMEGTCNLIESAWRAGVGLYLQLSETNAYVNGREEWLDESAAFDIAPRKAVQTLAVAEMERQVRGASQVGLDWAILRVGTLLGSGTFQDDFITRLRRGGEKVPGDGRHFISPVHVADAAEAFVLASQKRRNERIFNIVDEPVRFGDYADQMADRLRATRPTRDLSCPPPSSHRCSNELAKRELGWTPHLGFYKRQGAVSIG